MSQEYRVRYLRQGEAVILEQLFQANDESSLRLLLENTGFTVFSIRRVSAGSLKSTRINRQHFPLFCKEVRTLIRAGMTVVEAVETLSQRSKLRQQDNIAAALLSKLQQGQALSSALEAIVGTPPVLIAAVRAGERTSNLAEALDDYLRFDSLIEQLRRKVISASIYPLLVTGLGIAISLFLLMVVMPNFARMYQNLRGSATGSTAWMIAFSQYLSAHRLEVFTTMLLILFSLVVWVKTGRAKKFAMSVVGNIPWLRNRLQDFELAMMYQALALLLKGGYAMTQAIEVAGQSALSSQLSAALSKANKRIEQGGSVAQSMSSEGLCDEVDRRLMAAAERNGDFYIATDVVSRMHGERFELFIERVTRIVEPVLLLLVALIVGTIVVMMYLPVFDMATRLR
jgi:general secretion pathway protein F